MSRRRRAFNNKPDALPRRDRRRPGSPHRPLGYEALEDRRMLSTIAWNRGTGPGAADLDGLNAVFGLQTGVEFNDSLGRISYAFVELGRTMKSPRSGQNSPFLSGAGGVFASD